MRWDRTRLGVAICLLGLLAWLVPLLPGTSSWAVPWAMILGGALYLPGAYLIAFDVRSRSGKKRFWYLRAVRFGFVLGFLAMMFQVFGPPWGR